jgi:hypothetical protein
VNQVGPRQPIARIGDSHGLRRSVRCLTVGQCSSTSTRTSRARERWGYSKVCVGWDGPDESNHVSARRKAGKALLQVAGAAAKSRCNTSRVVVAQLHALGYTACCTLTVGARRTVKAAVNSIVGSTSIREHCVVCWCADRYTWVSRERAGPR